MKGICDESPKCIPGNNWYYDVSDLQPRTQTRGHQKTISYW